MLTHSIPAGFVKALKQPLVFFSIIPTGLDIMADEIVELAFKKFEPGGRVDPDLTIMTFKHERQMSTEAKRIFDPVADTSSSTTFEENAYSIWSIFSGCDLAGPRVHFDTLMLQHNLGRVGLVFSTKDLRLIDPLAIHYNTTDKGLGSIASNYGLELNHPCQTSSELLFAIIEKNTLSSDIEELQQLCYRWDTMYHQYLKGYHHKLNYYKDELMRSRLTSFIKMAIDSAKGDIVVFQQMLEREGVNLAYQKNQAEFIRDSVQITIPYFVLQNQGIKLEPASSRSFV